MDVIGDCITEINVTSPTCFQEIFDQTGCDVPALYVDALEKAAAGLTSLGRNLYDKTEASGEAMTGNPGESGLGTLSQNFLEMSNVNVVDEMVKMIVGQRAYEINSKAIQTADSMMQMVNNLKR